MFFKMRSVDKKSANDFASIHSSKFIIQFQFLFLFLFLLSNAQAATDFTLNFSLCNSTLGNKGFNCSTPINNQVLSFNETSGKWEPRSMNGLNYKGMWDANSSLPSTGLLNPGDYFVVSAANSPYLIGDWLILNESKVFERMTNSGGVVSALGRLGDVVAMEGDYDLDKMSDVNLVGKLSGDVLRFDGVNWIAAPFDITAVSEVTASTPIVVTNGSTTPALSIPAATNSVNGYLKSTDWTIFNSKEPAVVIPAAPTTKYYRGDKTFVTLDTSVVTENGNLYFTNNRVLTTQIAGLDATTAGTISASDTILSAFGKTQRQINSLSTGSGNYLLRSAADTLSGAVTLTGTITAAGAGDFVKSGSPATDNSAVNQTYADTKLAKAGGTMTGALSIDNSLKIKGASNYVTLRSSATTVADYTLTMPTTIGTSGYYLSTNGSGVTSWVAPPANGGGGGTVTSVTATTPLSVVSGTSTPDITIQAASSSTNGYITSSNWTTFNNKEPTIVAATVDPTKKFYRGDKNFTTIDSNVLATILAGVDNSLTGNIANGDSIVQAFGKTQYQLDNFVDNETGYLLKGTTDSISGAVTVGTTGSLLLTYTPTVGNDAVNKTYADTKVKKAGDNITGVLTLDNDFKLKAGSNHVTVKGSASAIGDYNFVLPLNDGNANEVLSTDGSGVTSWIAQTTSSITSLFGRTGAVVATSGDYTAGQLTNTAAGNIAATNVQAAINELDTEKQNTSSLAADIRATLLNSITFASDLPITAADSVLSAFGKLQAQLSALSTATSLKLAKANSSQTVTALAVSLTFNASGQYNVTNKNYVDNKSIQNLSYQSVSANYTVLVTDNSKMLGVTTGSTITLPDIATVPAGFQVYIKQMGDNNITVNTTSSQTIDDNTNLTFLSKYSVYQFVSMGDVWTVASQYIGVEPCAGTPLPGTVCNGGAIYLGSLSPGATSGSGTDRYMTTPGGCGEIPAGQIVGSGTSAYPSADFTPTCSGTDSLRKTWNNGSGNLKVVPGLTDYTTTDGTGQGAINTDLNYGSTNTTNIVAVTAGASGGYHAAARYCDRLNYGGYTDWYLPNRYELNLMWTNRASIPGLDTSGNVYWSSTEYDDSGAWLQEFNNGNQHAYDIKLNAYRLRCVRRF